mmetsp:Transcript_2035/g.3202  ORF Transcript_2035/g.3202 Transcript_2035/m.3202 type:complete len:281 (+) Transcript_2035:432-1274(+)
MGVVATPRRISPGDYRAVASERCEGRVSMRDVADGLKQVRHFNGVTAATREAPGHHREVIAHRRKGRFTGDQQLHSAGELAAHCGDVTPRRAISVGYHRAAVGNAGEGHSRGPTFLQIGEFGSTGLGIYPGPSESTAPAVGRSIRAQGQKGRGRSDDARDTRSQLCWQAGGTDGSTIFCIAECHHAARDVDSCVSGFVGDECAELHFYYAIVGDVFQSFLGAPADHMTSWSDGHVRSDTGNNLADLEVLGRNALGLGVAADIACTPRAQDIAAVNGGKRV